MSPRRTWISSIAITALIMSFARVEIAAQTSSDSAQVDMYYSMEVVEIVVGQDELPYSLSTVKAQEITRTNSVHIGAAVNATPGTWMQSGALNTNRISIRGVGNREPFATSKLKAYIDEIPLTNGVGESSIEDIDPSLLSQMDIWRNPASALWGAGLGGMIQMTPRTVDSNQLTVSLLGGSYGRFGLGISPDVQFGKKKQHALTLKYGYLNDDGYRENNQYDRHSATLHQRLKLADDRLTLTIFSHFIDLRAFIPSSLGITAFQETPEVAGGAWGQVHGREEYSKWINGVSARYSDGNKWTYHGSAFYHFFDSDEVRPFNILQERRNTIGTRQRAMFAFNTQDFVTLGFEYFNEDYEWQTFETLDGGDKGEQLTDQSEQRDYFNLFLQGQWHASTRLFLHGGLNLNKTGMDAGDQILSYNAVLSPSLGVSYKIDPNNLVLFGSASRGFSPIAIADALDADGNVNADLKPEVGWNYELGMRYRSNDMRFQGAITAYHMRIQNLVVRKRITEIYYETINAGRTLHQGFEIEGRYSVGQMYIKGAYTIAFHKFDEYVDDDEDYSGNRLTGTPRLIFHHTIGYTTNSPNAFSISLDQHYVGETPINDDNTVFGDDFLLFDLHTSIRIPVAAHRHTVELTASIINIFDAHYASMYQINAPSFGGSEPRYYYPGQPRSFYIGVRLTI